MKIMQIASSVCPQLTKQEMAGCFEEIKSNEIFINEDHKLSITTFFIQKNLSSCTANSGPSLLNGRGETTRGETTQCERAEGRTDPIPPRPRSKSQGTFFFLLFVPG